MRCLPHPLPGEFVEELILVLEVGPGLAAIAEGVCVTRHPYHCRRRDSAHPDPPTLSSEAYLSPSTTTLPSLCPILAQASTSTLPRHHEHPLPKSLRQGMRKRDARGPRKPPCPSPVYHDERACNL